MVKAQGVVFDETMTDEERVDLITSSMHIPLAFPPTHVEDMLLNDGGLMSNLSLGDPIQRCRDEGYDDKDIVVDMLLCYRKPLLLKAWGKNGIDWQNAWQYY